MLWYPRSCDVSSTVTQRLGALWATKLTRRPLGSSRHQAMGRSVRTSSLRRAILKPRTPPPGCRQRSLQVPALLSQMTSTQIQRSQILILQTLKSQNQTNQSLLSHAIQQGEKFSRRMVEDPVHYSSIRYSHGTCHLPRGHQLITIQRVVASHG